MQMMENPPPGRGATAGREGRRCLASGHQAAQQVTQQAAAAPAGAAAQRAVAAPPVVPVRAAPVTAPAERFAACSCHGPAPVESVVCAEYAMTVTPGRGMRPGLPWLMHFL
jgi:hypothetical protein